MLDWIQKKIGKRTSHPMRGPAEAAKLLADLPVEPLRAVEEVAAWLESLASATSFGVGNRLQVISLTDEAGQPMVEELTHVYLAAEAKREAGRFRQWQALVDFWERLAGAYQLIALQIEVSKKSEDLATQIPVITVRAMRAIFHQMRLALMRYAGAPERAWPSLYHLYSFAHDRHLAATPVRPYPWGTMSTTARLELVRAVMLEAAAPQSLPPREIDLTARVSARLASSFAYSEVPGPQFPLYVDLAQTRAPLPVPKDLQPTPTMRFFGPGAAGVRLKELLEGARAPQGTEQPYAEEFSAAERIETFERLLLYWSDNPPRRQHARTRLSNNVDVAFGLEAIKQLIARGEQTVASDETEKFQVNFDEDELENREPGAVPIERWKLKDASMHGLGAVTTRRAQGALRIGALMAFRLEQSDTWCVGIVRRLQTDTQKNSQVGAEIFSKDPQLLWMRKLGIKHDQAWNWEVRDQKSLQHFTQGVLLAPDASGGGEGSLLLSPKSYYPDETFGLMVDHKPRKLQVGAVLEKGDGFDRLAFKWIAVDAALQAKIASASEPPPPQKPAAPTAASPADLSLEPLSLPPGAVQPPAKQPQQEPSPAEKSPLKGFLDDAI